MHGPIEDVGYFYGYHSVRIGDLWMNVWKGSNDGTTFHGDNDGITFARPCPKPDPAWPRTPSPYSAVFAPLSRGPSPY